jgi:hypothetical protein
LSLFPNIQKTRHEQIFCLGGLHLDKRLNWPQVFPELAYQGDCPSYFSWISRDASVSIDGGAFIVPHKLHISILLESFQFLKHRSRLFDESKPSLDFLGFNPHDQGFQELFKHSVPLSVKFR